jgi:site-specific DNA-methyltransferase (adenine-specific)/modification methylase
MSKVIIGNATLYLGDCMDILPTLGKVDAVITDPPYGIGADKMTLGNGKRKIERGDMEWDSSPPSNELMALIHSKADLHIYWGGNYFGLPASRCWLVWDKCTGANSFADCELAWTDIDSVVRKIALPWVGANAKDESGERVHPTQKPLGVMRWSIEKCKPQPQTILDPFMGSGTTGVAAIQLGRKFIGIEREPKYFDIACKRIEQTVAQGQLFAPEPMKQIQEALDV